MKRGNTTRLSVIKGLCAFAIVAGSCLVAYAQSCGCLDLKDIDNFMYQQDKSGNTYKSSRDAFRDLERAEGGPRSYDDDGYQAVSKASGRAATCSEGMGFQAASTSGLTCSVGNYQYRDCNGGVHDGYPTPCMKSLVDAHEKVHQDACSRINSEHSFMGIHGNYKSNQSMLEAMQEEVDAHKAGYDNAAKEKENVLKIIRETCCKPGGATLTVKPRLMEIVRNLLR